jgi:hypothetical protein
MIGALFLATLTQLYNVASFMPKSRAVFAMGWGDVAGVSHLIFN